MHGQEIVAQQSGIGNNPHDKVGRLINGSTLDGQLIGDGLDPHWWPEHTVCFILCLKV